MGKLAVILGIGLVLAFPGGWPGGDNKPTRPILARLMDYWNKC